MFATLHPKVGSLSWSGLSWGLCLGVITLLLAVSGCSSHEAAGKETPKTAVDSKKINVAKNGGADDPASPKGYYLGWADVEPVGRKLQISFNPIDCNVASLTAILPLTNAVLVVDFHVPLLPDLEEQGGRAAGYVAAGTARVITEEAIQELRPRPRLLLENNGASLRIALPSGLSWKADDLILFTGHQMDGLSSIADFLELVVVEHRSLGHDLDLVSLLLPNTPRLVEADRDAALDSPTLARVISNDTNLSLSAVCHILLFYGLGPTDLPMLSSGMMALKALTG